MFEINVFWIFYGHHGLSQKKNPETISGLLSSILLKISTTIPTA
jgi:hypothetical protein